MRDRRKHERFRGRISAFLEHESEDGKSFSVAAEIEDISIEGCSLLFPATEEVTDSSLLTIVPCAYPYIELAKVPCTVIYDTRPTPYSSDPSVARRCGIKFGELSDMQKSQLTFIIQNCTD